MRSVGVTRRRRRLAAAAALALAVAGHASAASAAAPTRYTLANGCYALQGPSGQVIAGADRVRMQATTLGSYLLYRPDRTFLAAQGDGSVAPAPEPSPAADWRVREAGEGTFTPVAGIGGGAHADGAFRPGDRLRRLPRGRPERDRHAGHEPAVRKGRRPGRRPHALDDVRVPGRQLPLRPPVASVRHPVRAAGLLLDRGAAGRRRRRPRTSSTSATPRRRTTRAGIRSSPPGRPETSPTRERTGAGSSEPGWAGCASWS